jgi:hypothetical protein
MAHPGHLIQRGLEPNCEWPKTAADLRNSFNGFPVRTLFRSFRPQSCPSAATYSRTDLKRPDAPTGESTPRHHDIRVGGRQPALARRSAGGDRGGTRPSISPHSPAAARALTGPVRDGGRQLTAYPPPRRGHDPSANGKSRSRTPRWRRQILHRVSHEHARVGLGPWRPPGRRGSVVLRSRLA